MLIKVASCDMFNQKCLSPSKVVCDVDRYESKAVVAEVEVVACGGGGGRCKPRMLYFRLLKRLFVSNSY